MSVVSYRVRDYLKKIPIIERLNKTTKAYQFRRNLKRLQAIYTEKAIQAGLQYDEQDALQLARQRIAKTSGNLDPNGEKIKLFWVGANYDQDRSGILQALERYCDVTYLYRSDGEYGQSYWDRQGRVQIYNPQLVSENDANLLDQVRKAVNCGGIDLLMGQMWANYLSEEALAEIQGMGIPIVNISMDDRLPDNWSKKNGTRLGAVGLVGSTDAVLTTTGEACSWYMVEGCPALFWPLASDPDFFSHDPDKERDLDVVFVGNRYGIRARIVDYLTDQGINVSAWGGGWPNGYVTAEECAALFKRAKIILGVGTVGYCDNVYTLKLRDFDAPMAGALYVTHDNPDLYQLYKNKEEIVLYKNDQECAEIIKYYLLNDDKRINIARLGQEKAKKYYSWEVRISETISKLFF